MAAMAFRKKLRREVAKADPRSAEQKAARAAEGRDDDLAAACQHDHYSVHEAGWQIRRLDDGTVEWISSTGHSYRVPPATYPIDTTSQHAAPAEGEDQTDHARGRQRSRPRPG